MEHYLPQLCHQGPGKHNIVEIEVLLSISIKMGEPVLRIEGPFCTMSCCCNDVEFRVLSAQTGEQVGIITKQWQAVEVRQQHLVLISIFYS